MLFNKDSIENKGFLVGEWLMGSGGLVSLNDWVTIRWVRPFKIKCRLSAVVIKTQK